MPEIAKPERATYFIARSADGSVVHYGITQPHQVTTTGQGVLEFSADEPEFLGIAQPYADKFPDLPSEGELTAGDPYKFGTTVVIVRQTHNRTEFDPADTPALFLTSNSTQDWIENESVSVGTRRLYEGQWYQARIAHVTEFTPDLTPALWVAITIGPDAPAWEQGGGTGTAGSYNQDYRWSADPDDTQVVEVTHTNAQDSGNVWLFRSKIAANTTEPGTDGTFHRWWDPIEAI